MSEADQTPLIPGTEPPFVRRFFVEREDLVAARWWQERMEARAGAFAQVEGDVDLARRNMIIGVVASFSGLALMGLWSRFEGDDDDDDVLTDALDLQRSEGWSFNAKNRRLVFLGAYGLDCDDNGDWRQRLDQLASIATPTQAGLMPYAVQTLFQVLSSPSFRNVLVPVSTPDMDRAFARGQALAALFRDPREADGAAVIVDAAGPDAVAVAAGLCNELEPVFLFDNWPHPDGVVASHEVLGAAAYYQPILTRGRGIRAARRGRVPPAFILDRQRLSPYRDQPDKFDNRYLARLPSPWGFSGLGVRRIVYLTDSGARLEADDLNDDFVALARSGIEFQLAQLTDAPVVNASYHPAARETIFATHTANGSVGVGRQRPQGFGRVSVVRARGSGAVVGRSGSFGRGGWSYGG